MHDVVEPVLQRSFDRSLHEDLCRARETSPTAIDADSAAVIVLGYHEVERLAHDGRLAGVGLSFFDYMGIDDGELRRWYGSLMFTNEGDHHSRLRRLVARAFTPRSVDRHRALAAELAHSTLAELTEQGGGDLVDAFADLPITVICRLLGVPDDQVAEFRRYADALSPVFGFMDANQIEAASEAVVRLGDDVDRMIADRAHERGDDVISALLAAEDEGDRLSHEELVAMVGNLIVGGHDTTASQIGCSLLSLLANPSVTGDLAKGAVTAGDVVSETIRYEPSIPGIPRTLLEPVEIGGTQREAGSMIILSTASANREKAIWGDPDVLRPARFTEPDAPRLLSFGSGAHYCLGTALARMTLEEVVIGFAACADHLHSDVDLDTVDWRQVLGRSPASLNVNC